MGKAMNTELCTYYDRIPPRISGPGRDSTLEITYVLRLELLICHAIWVTIQLPI
jgi:hypothetical protein